MPPEVTEEVLLVEEALTERLSCLEEAGLGSICLLVQQDLLLQIFDHPHAVDVDLKLVAEGLKDAEDRDDVANLDVLLEQPVAEVGLSRRGRLTSLVAEVIEPKYAADDARAVIDAEEMLLLSLDVIDNGSGDVDALQQPLIAEDEENFAPLPPIGHHVLMQLHAQVIFVFHQRIAVLLESLLALTPIEHIVAQLDHVHREVYVRYIKVE